jgi:hypothetical protein
MQSRLHSLGLAAVTLASLVAVPSAHAADIWAVTTSNSLARYDSGNTSTPLSSYSITGLVASDGVTSNPFGQITDITFVGSTLYGIDNNANLYTLNLGTGAATLVSSTFNPTGFDLGVAYDSFTGGLRVVTDAGENFSATLGGTFTAGASVSVVTGVSDVNQGASLAFSGLAIDSDFGIGYAFDTNLDDLFVTNDANFEVFSTVGGLTGNYTALASFDMIDGTLYASLSEDSNTSALYIIDTITGQETLIGAFGTGITAIAAIPEPSSFAALAGLAGLGLASFSRRRRATAAA